MKRVNKIFNWLVSVAPFLMLYATFATAVVSSLDWYLGIYKYLPDSIGYSILTNLVFIKYYFRKAYCNPTKVAVVGLLVMNLLSIVTKGLDFYNSMYDIVIGFFAIVTIIIFKIKRW